MTRLTAIRSYGSLRLTPSFRLHLGPSTKGHFGVNHQADVIWDGRSCGDILKAMCETRAQLSDSPLACLRLPIARHTVS